ncbi:MAG TPA: twin-arginine translocase TatA/TatE family subunit [Isosphaeraceae bacterium]|nr:twin-arginine translocase TatA/TatE family subunit [Isosphaeraceae bacterium]
MMPQGFFLPNLGPMELVIVAGICLLFFGNRLPSVMRSLGQGVTEFKKGMRDDGDPNGPPAIP